MTYCITIYSLLVHFRQQTRQHVLIFPPAYRVPKPHASCRQHALLSPPAAKQWTCLLLHAAYGLQRTHRLTMHCQWGWLSSLSFFVPGDLNLWPWYSNSGEIFVQCT